MAAVEEGFETAGSGMLARTGGKRVMPAVSGLKPPCTADACAQSSHNYVHEFFFSSEI